MLSARLLTPEPTHFLGGMDISDQGRQNLKGWARRFQEEILSQNSVKILLTYGEHLNSEIESYYGLSGSLWALLRRAVVFDDDKAMNDFLEQSGEVITAVARSQVLSFDIDVLSVDDIGLLRK